MLTAMTALVRANARALCMGMLIGLAPAALVFTWLALWPSNIPTHPGDLLPAVSLIAVGCGLVAGAIARERWRSLLYLPVLSLLWFFSGGLADSLHPLAAILWVGLAYAILGRITAWYFQGNAVSAILGAMGMSVTAIFIGAVMMAGTAQSPWTDNSLFFPVAGTALLGSAGVGALLGAKVKRRRRA
jgi:hypothetical protein